MHLQQRLNLTMELSTVCSNTVFVSTVKSKSDTSLNQIINKQDIFIIKTLSNTCLKRVLTFVRNK